MNYNTLFNSNGKIPTWSDFFKGEGADIFTSKNGIVDGFKTVLGEQIIHTRLPYRTPIYSLGISAPLLEGDGWTERLINPTTTYKLNPKATAQDDLGFYDSTGVEKVFQTNFSGRKSVSTSSDLEIKALINNGAGSGVINDKLVDGMQKDVQGELEAMAGKLLVSTIAKEETAIANTPEAIRTAISEIAIDMKTSATTYSDMARDTEYSDEVVCLIPAKMARSLSNSEAILPNAGALNVECQVIPVYGDLPTPITTAEYQEQVSGVARWDQSITPKALGKDKPSFVIMDKKYFEIRPYINEYKMTSSYNSAGDFRNYHILYKGAMGYKPWRNAVRCYVA